MTKQNFTKLSTDLYIDADYRQGFANAGLGSIDDVFEFTGGKQLIKSNIGSFRTRIQFDIPGMDNCFFMKRYASPPIPKQLKNWLSHGKHASMAHFDHFAADALSKTGINTPKTIAFGEQWNGFFEKRSFCITEQIPNAEALERKLPDSFKNDSPNISSTVQKITPEKLNKRRQFICDLAEFVRKFHDTGFRHRDLYLSHIFYDDRGRFHLIDLARCFKPAVLSDRYRVKDIAQLFYSAPGSVFTHTDRMRFYKALTGVRKITPSDKLFIRKVIRKANRIARHDIKHGRKVPFAT
jgi:heptose I phosphotransferase